MALQVAVVTLFPAMLEAITGYGITRRAVERGLLAVQTVNPRDFTSDRHRTVDDRPFGGGPGMLMKVEPLAAAIDHARRRLPAAKVIYLSPAGVPLEQDRVLALAAAAQAERTEAKADSTDSTAGQAGLILLAGRYEGIDERLLDSLIDEEISIGDYVLSGGELPAMVLIDALTRCLPGVLGDDASAEQDSFSGDNRYLLDCPHYTRPEVYAGCSVPAVLLSGHHQAIRRWRLKQSLGRTATRRPDLLAVRRRAIGLSDEEEQLLAEYLREQPSGSDTE